MMPQQSSNKILDLRATQPVFVEWIHESACHLLPLPAGWLLDTHSSEQCACSSCGQPSPPLNNLRLRQHTLHPLTLSPGLPSWAPCLALFSNISSSPGAASSHAQLWVHSTKQPSQVSSLPTWCSPGDSPGGQENQHLRQPHPGVSPDGARVLPELLLEPQTSQLGAGGRVSEQHFPSSHWLFPDTGHLASPAFLPVPRGVWVGFARELHLPGLWTLT